MTLLLAPGTRLTAELEIKRSRFLALVARADSAEDARAVVVQRRTDMPDARHHCSAWTVDNPDAQPTANFSDDGEPSGTAGRPMMDVLAGAGLHNVVAVVTRYFGGTLLGTGGLVRAYSDAVREAIEGAPIVTRTRIPEYEALLPHADAGRYLAELAGAFDVTTEYLAEGVRILVPTTDGEALRSLLANRSQGLVGIRERGLVDHDVAAGVLRAGTPSLQ